jgi:hypothetical protein
MGSTTSQWIVTPRQLFKILLPNARDIRITIGAAGLEIDQ